MSDNPDTELFNAVMESHLARMSDSDWHALTKRVRPPAEPALPQTREQALRVSLAAKSAMLQSVPRDANGALGSMQAAADAINARIGNPQPPLPQPELATPQSGFSQNRAQGASSDSAWAPVREKDLNTQKISDILNRRP